MNSKQLVSTLAIAITVVGCGGSGANSATNPFTGNYTSSLKLDGNKPATLALNVSSTGDATGTLTVTAPAATPSRGASSGFSFSIGTHNVSGSVGSDGTINITGTDTGTGAGTFTVGGQISSGGSGTLNVIAGGVTYTATISAASTGNTGALTFSNGSGTNADLSAYPANPFILTSSVGESMSIVVAPPGGGNARTFTLMLGSTATPGTTFTYGTVQSTFNVMLYGEGNTKSWRATSGTATVVSRTASTFELQFNNVNLVAESDTSATGSFTLNGTLKK
ncbi:MAG: hypothetical protein WCK51_10110 [Armatimonadota bacterium]